MSYCYRGCHKQALAHGSTNRYLLSTFHWQGSDEVFSSNRPTGPIRSSSRIVCLCVCLLSPFHVLDFEAYFAPTSRSRMSKVFRDSESLGKSAGKSGLRIEHFSYEVV